MVFDAAALRVLGSLMEKEMTTPESYPLSLNALVNACNQRSSREPVTDMTEDQVRQALHHLQSINWVHPVRDARVAKYEHRVRTVLQLRRDETAILCLLLLRGAQTPGELRSRSDRMFSFDDLEAVQATLTRLASRLAEETNDFSGPLVAVLPRQPGSSAQRWIHLLAGPAPLSAGPAQAGSTTSPAEPRMSGQRIDLETRVAKLETQVGDLLAFIAKTFPAEFDLQSGSLPESLE